MKEAFFDERGIYYRASDIKDDRPTLLFVHGLSGSSSVWLPYERHFESSYNIVSPDLRGHGKSRKQFFYGAYEPELIADDVVALLKHLSISRAVIIGHSFGTFIAVSILKLAPERFSAAIFLSPTYGASHAWWLPLARIVASIFGFLSIFLPFDPRGRGHVNYEKYAPTGDWSLSRIIPDIKNTSARVYIFCMRHIYKLDTDAWWREVKIPSLIIHGKKDTIIPFEKAERLHALWPHSQLILMDNANHILPVNDVPEVIAVLSSFLARIFVRDRVRP